MNSASGAIASQAACRLAIGLGVERRVRERIELAASRAGRTAGEITLIAVSKTHSPRKIQELYEAGVRHFGENRVQEYESKRAQLASLDAIWHMIGHLQTNKAARAVRLFDTIDSVDSFALAEKLNHAKAAFTTEDAENPEKKAAGRESDRLSFPSRLRVLIEVKLDPEPAKSGVEAEELPQLVETVLSLPHLELQGLMGIPPYFDDPQETRPYFRRLYELRDSLRVQKGPKILPVLSTGMSHDFEVAIEEGATEVRIGTALFGEREAP
jgi:pyridoxal phosphate enzyme (YggS family)